jgi:hypothetical protein
MGAKSGTAAKLLATTGSAQVHGHRNYENPEQKQPLGYRVAHSAQVVDR